MLIARTTGARGAMVELRDVARAPGRGPSVAVGEVEDDVGVVERGERGAAHGALERILRIEEPGRVEHDHLHVASVRMPTMRSRVDWGFSLTMLSFCPTMRLSSVDFPALGFPTTVTIPALGISES